MDLEHALTAAKSDNRPGLGPGGVGEGLRFREEIGGRGERRRDRGRNHRKLPPPPPPLASIFCGTTEKAEVSS